MSKNISIKQYKIHKMQLITQQMEILACASNSTLGGRNEAIDMALMLYLLLCHL